jgi:lysophospholipase L1-like esterase
LIIVPTIDATQERVHFSNLMGKTPVTIGAARIAAAIGAGPAIDPTRDLPLTFNDTSSVTIPPGQEVVSDPVNVSYQYGEKLAVSVYLKGTFGPLTVHGSEVQTNYATSIGAGDATSSANGTAFTSTNTEWYMLTGVDVYGSYQGTVAIFGSSSVDGHASSDGDTNSYPIANEPIATQDHDRPSDWLARELLAAGYRMGVLNAGAIADPAAEDATTASGLSVAGVDRLNHDVLQQAGIKAVVIYTGGIDLRADCKPASDVEASLTNLVQQAQQAGVRVILATLPPSEYCITSTANLVPSPENPYAGDLSPGPENPGSTQRRILNDWIRSSGAQLPGVVAIADFDKVLSDPNHPDFMLPNLNSGDNFHPNGTGYGVQSSAIPLDAILGQ